MLHLTLRNRHMRQADVESLFLRLELFFCVWGLKSLAVDTRKAGALAAIWSRAWGEEVVRSVRASLADIFSCCTQ